MIAREAKSFCRICAGFCGMIVTRDDNGRIAEIRADREHPMSAGYACFKGLQAPTMHNGPGRILHPLKRVRGELVQIPLDEALDEIAAIIAATLSRDGADAVGMFRGTGGYNHAAAFQMQSDFMAAIGSNSFYSTITIDQSAKMVTAGRLGSWNAGRHGFHDSDVMMVFGGNPIVSMALMGYENFNSTKATKAAKARGMKLIVIDPRRSELAAHAELFLQPRAGEDVAIASAMLHVILREGWYDTEFCRRHVSGLDDLRTALEPFTEVYAAARAGIDAQAIVAAAALFARDSERGIAVTGTGPCMAAHSNLADHLVETLNVVCGRFRREGELVSNPGVLSPPRPFRAEVVPPTRPWTAGPQSRIRGMGMIGGEKMSATLADEILTPGEGQLKVLIVDGGNPASGMPDQRRAIEALRRSECLIAIEPCMTNTARIADFVIPPELQYERPAISNMNVAYESAISQRCFQQYTPAVSKPPADSEVIDDARFLWEIARRLGRQIVFDGVPLDMETPPEHEDLIATVTRQARVPLSEVKRFPAGKIFTHDVRVGPGRPEAGLFEVAPPDVVSELAEVRAAASCVSSIAYPFQLISRRMRDTMNSYGLSIDGIRARHRHNPAYMNPADLAELGIESGGLIEIKSAAGSIQAIAAPDLTLRRGIVSISHCWGGLPDDSVDPASSGSSTSLLVATNAPFEVINAMPRMSAIPVAIRGIGCFD